MLLVVLGNLSTLTSWHSAGLCDSMIFVALLHRKAIAPLLRFTSSKSGEGITSLTEYIERAKPGQKSIYYIAADSLGAAASAPFVEQLIKKDLEVCGRHRAGHMLWRHTAWCSVQPSRVLSVLACEVSEGAAHPCAIPC